MMRIEKAAVLGAGTMGAQIAAHLANARIPTLLLDIVPGELTEEEKSKGLTLDSKQARNRIARTGLEAAKKAKPAAFLTPEVASLVTIGNFDDDLAKLKDCDLIIEAVVENLEIKRKLYERVEQHRRPGSVIASSNCVARSAGQTFPLAPVSAAARARREARSAPRRGVSNMMGLLRCP